MSDWIERGLCWVFAIAFLALVFRFAHRERYFLATFCLIATVIAALCGVTWFQGLMKTGIIRVVTTTLTAYGNRLDGFQKTVEEMQASITKQQAQLSVQQQQILTQQLQLSGAQSNILSQQTIMTDQFQQITSLQGELTVAQRTITEQAKKLDDIEFLSKNLFENMRREVIPGSDTNRVAVQRFSNGVCRVAIKLDEATFLKSVQGTYESPGNLGIPFPLIVHAQLPNVIFSIFAAGADPKVMTFNVNYVRDTRAATNAVKRLEFRGGRFMADNELVHFPDYEPLPPP